MNNQAFVLLANLAPTINQVANRISIAGHTDAMPFQKNEDYTNWELSVDRANAARNALISGGLQEDKIARVVGMSSTVLFDPANPGGSSNRRISIVVLNKGVDQSIRMQEEKLNAIIQKTMKDKLEHVQ
jgi:chemotaxis protein MotB